MTARHPMQPYVQDDHGVIRFKENKLVSMLLEAGPYDLNRLITMVYAEQASKEDYDQLMQLIGYSGSGYMDLSTTSKRNYKKASHRYEKFLNLLKQREVPAQEHELDLWLTYPPTDGQDSIVKEMLELIHAAVPEGRQLNKMLGKHDHGPDLNWNADNGPKIQYKITVRFTTVPKKGTA